MTTSTMMLAVRCAQFLEMLARHQNNPNSPSWSSVRAQAIDLRAKLDQCLAETGKDEEAPRG